MYTDVHAHLNFSQYGDLERTIEEFKRVGTDTVICSGFDIASSEESAKIAAEHEGIFFSAGWQPQELGRMKDGDMERLKELCLDKKCVAVGEIGLDYHYPDNPDRQTQKKVFVACLELAKELKLPVIIHSRDCAEDMITLLRENRDKLDCGGAMHCYSHSAQMVKDFLDLGFYLSFGGTSTYSGSKKVLRSVEAAPSDRILSETDSPYLTPEPFRGEFPNTPKNIPFICERLAAIKGVSTEEMAHAIRENARRLFKKLG